MPVRRSILWLPSTPCVRHDSCGVGLELQLFLPLFSPFLFFCGTRLAGDRPFWSTSPRLECLNLIDGETVHLPPIPCDIAVDCVYDIDSCPMRSLEWRQNIGPPVCLLSAASLRVHCSKEHKQCFYRDVTATWHLVWNDYSKVCFLHFLPTSRVERASI